MNSRIGTIVFGVCLSFLPAVAAQQTPFVSLEQVQSAMQPLTPHPRLLLTDADLPAVQKNLQMDPILKSYYAVMLTQADSLLDQPPLERKLTGIRLLEISRQCLSRTILLSSAYRYSRERKYLKRAEQEMLAAAAFPDWNPSHYLDVAEMIAALAIGYDWLYANLPPTSRDAIRQAILEKGLQTSLDETQPYNGWMRHQNNWMQVCHGGLTLGALAIAEDQPELTVSILHRAVNALSMYMNEYEPDGVYVEGPMYWWYGTTYNVLMLAALDSALHTNFGLSRLNGFMKTPDYYLHMTGPAGQHFNYSDCGVWKPIVAAPFWFAKAAHKPYLIWNERKLIEQYAASQPDRLASETLWTLIPLWWMDAKEPPADLAWLGQGKNPVAAFRSSWTDPNATYLAIKGGSPRISHAHMDIGSFVLDADGVRWAIDLGAEDYHTLESKGVKQWSQDPDSQRWTIFRYQNLSHNCLTVNDQNQRAEGFAPITEFSNRREFPHAVINLNDIYREQLKVASRGAALLPDGSVLIQDELLAAETPATVRWAMATPAKVEIQSDTTALLTQNGKTLKLELSADTPTRLTTYSTEPKKDYDSPNPGTILIGFEVSLAPAEKTTLRIRLIPNPDQQPAKPIPLLPLAQWANISSEISP